RVRVQLLGHRLGTRLRGPEPRHPGDLVHRLGAGRVLCRHEHRDRCNRAARHSPPTDCEVAVAVAAPGKPSAAQRRERRTDRHPWLAVLWTAVRTPRGAVGLCLASLIVLLAIIGPLGSPGSPPDLATLAFAKPSDHFPLGSDFLGRDVLSRVLNGGWILLIMAAAATAFEIVVGTAAGVSAAYRRGRTDGLIMRTVDVILAFPQLVFALLLVSVIGPKLWLILLALCFSPAP